MAFKRVDLSSFHTPVEVERWRDTTKPGRNDPSPSSVSDLKSCPPSHSRLLPNRELSPACGLHCFSRVRLFATPGAAARQVPPSVGFSRQEYGSGLLFPSPGDLPDPGIEPPSLRSPALAGGFFTTSSTWEAPISCRPRFHSSHLYQTILASNSKQFACLCPCSRRNPSVMSTLYPWRPTQRLWNTVLGN